MHAASLVSFKDTLPCAMTYLEQVIFPETALLPMAALSTLLVRRATVAARLVISPVTALRLRSMVMLHLHPRPNPHPLPLPHPPLFRQLLLPLLSHRQVVS